MNFLRPEVVKKIFIHELGHFIAIRYSEKWNNISFLEKFYINESNSDGKYKCNGGVATKEEILEKLEYKEQIGIKIMGCVFQTMDSEYEIENCLLTNGEIDKNHIRSCLNAIKRKHCFKDIVDITNNFISKSNKEIRLLFDDTINNIELEKYFHLVDENEYEIDMIELDKHLLSFFDFYENYYKGYLEKIEEKIV